MEYSRSLKQLHQLSYLKPGITLTRELFYERRPFATILVLTTRKRGCEEDRITKSIIRKIQIMWMLLLSSPQLTSPYISKMGLVRESDQVCYHPSTSYNSTTGDLGHQGSSVIAILD